MSRSRSLQRAKVGRPYFTRVVRLSYLATDITQAILEGRQPRERMDRHDRATPGATRSHLRLCFVLPSKDEIRAGFAAFARVCFRRPAFQSRAPTSAAPPLQVELAP